VERYSRQQGLVVQDVLADAEIAVTGTGPAVTYLLQCLAMLGVATRHGRLHLWMADRKATPDDVAGQFLLRPDDVDDQLDAALVRRVGDIDPAVNISAGGSVPPGVLTVAVPAAGEPIGDADLWGRVGAATVTIGPGRPPAPVEPASANALTPALACVCGGLLAQTVLNRLGAVITGPAVLSGWTEERLWLSHPGIGRDARATRLEAPVLSGVLAAPDFRILHDGEPVEARITTVVDHDNVVVSLPRRPTPAGTATTVRPIRLPAPPVRPLTWTPFAGPGVTVPVRIPASRVVMCGAGALGGWAGATLAVAPADGLDLCVVDMDGEVERHNLNRQVLYTGADIGRPKAYRAVERLAEINPAVGLRGIQTVIDVHSRDQLLGDEVMLGEDPAVAAQRSRIDELSAALRAADAVLSCPDNHRTRWVLNCLTERLGIPLVNGAVDGFVGRVHVCDPGDSGRCLVCWLGRSVAQDPKRRSCTDTIGPAPVPSIVTSAAIIGGVQTATLIAELTGNAVAVARFHALDGADGVLTGYRAAGRDPEECPAHLFLDTAAEEPR
jgi:molybdopterin/thiamine biosynthesis adenylyltransferase